MGFHQVDATSKLLCAVSPGVLLGFRKLDVYKRVGLDFGDDPDVSISKETKALSDTDLEAIAAVRQITEGSEQGRTLCEKWLPDAASRDGLNFIWGRFNPPDNFGDPVARLKRLAKRCRDQEKSRQECDEINVPDTEAKPLPAGVSERWERGCPMLDGFPDALKDIDAEMHSGAKSFQKKELTEVAIWVLGALYVEYDGSFMGEQLFANWLRQWPRLIERAGGDEGISDLYATVGSLVAKDISDPAEKYASLAHLSSFPRPHDLWGNRITKACIDRGMVPDVIWNYASDVAERMGVDASITAMAGIATCAGALTDSVKIQPMEHDDSFTQSARLHVGVCAEPGVGKSPAMLKMLEPLEKVAERWTDEFNQQMDEYSRAAKSPGKNDKVRAKPREKRATIHDLTMEALADALEANPRGVIIWKDELPEYWASFDAYREGGQGKDRAAALGLADGGRRRIDRKKEGASRNVPNWGASLLGGIQPAKLRQWAPKLSDDGLVQRTIVTFGESTGPMLDRKPDKEAKAAYEKKIEDLAEEQCHAFRDVVTLSSEAHSWRKEVYEVAENIQNLPFYSAALKQHVAKWRGMFARILLTLHVAQTESDPITGFPPVSGDTAKMARDLMLKFIWPNQVRFYSEFFEKHDANREHARWIAGHILAHKLERITARDIAVAYRELRDLKDRHILIDAMKTLHAANWVEAPVEGKRNSVSWTVNPMVHVLFEERASEEAEERERVKAQITDAVQKLRKSGL